jgi:type II secretory pathway component GspD/PulD (secretin)
MKSNCEETAGRLRRVRVFAGVMLTMTLIVPMVGAQTQGAEQRAGEVKPAAQISQTFFLKNATQMRELLDIQTDLRNMLGRAKIYGVMTQNAISVQGSAEDVAQAGKLIEELDRPRKAYRLTYTLTVMDGGKKTGAEHFSLVVVAGEKAVLKQGNRVPIVTGSYGTDSAKQGDQVQYVDVGLSIEASLDGERLLTKVEQTSLAEERAGVSARDPMIQQTVLEGQSNLTPGKAVVLGSFDVPGSTRHEEVEVVSELVP